jgi:hypothetical protein
MAKLKEGIISFLTFPQIRLMGYMAKIKSDNNGQLFVNTQYPIQAINVLAVEFDDDENFVKFHYNFIIKNQKNAAQLLDGGKQGNFLRLQYYY